MGWPLMSDILGKTLILYPLPKKCAAFYTKLCILNFTALGHCSAVRVRTQFQNIFFRIVFGTHFGQREKCIILSEKTTFKVAFFNYVDKILAFFDHLPRVLRLSRNSFDSNFS